ncbi:N-acetyl-gamma-glutamyl-phosphate reductase [Ahniella affigens]|uniref:N-acetyl-gamma-glutamyl-phosphate reductase n=1 Tax=Ahniella affigens TaxID=2021234 RepID=A0A2P1PPK5_9GAMM|nr:N-acetyl-gamma-glutamyl-phosphate reductase [Ahniella affigens]AVP96773.1 N-acetyl-gamma-glutamyl-phosphate reductase [Ahniella affigens]
MTKRIGLIGARGHVGAELVRWLEKHPEFELGLAVSRSVAGQPVCALIPESRSHLRFVDQKPEAIAQSGMDALVLAMPNNEATAYVAAVEALAPDTVVLDLSADYRFDASWYYGLPELTRSHASGQRRISNPGCYATAMQLAVAPFKDLLVGATQCFGVSGYSGAGTTPSDRNNPEKLRDNLMPYSSIGHIHEREVSAQLGTTIEFMPTVAGYFRGITMTCNLHFREPQTLADVQARLSNAYSNEPLIELSDTAPWVNRIAGKPGGMIGGLTISKDGQRAVIVSVLDNLLKGAATQALQNLNLAFGLPETTGLVA